eukprot:COSAG01_NODE_373_length_17991_cov_284.890075_9_plen_72_part_00
MHGVSIGIPECFGCSGSCNVNAACPMGDDWTNEVAGCVRLLTAGGSSLCSGEWHGLVLLTGGAMRAIHQQL